MSNWPWNHLDQYCADPTQRAWVEEQLSISPIRPGQSPEDWLLYRSMIAEGQTEAEAWLNAHLFRQNGDAGAILSQPDFPVPHHQPTPPPAHLSPLPRSYALDNTAFQLQQPNGYYQEHGQYSQHQQQQSQQQQQARQPAPPAQYGFVNLQEVAPYPANQQYYSSSPQNHHQQPLELYGQSVYNERGPVPGPSIIRKPSHQSAPSHPSTINPAHLNVAPVQIVPQDIKSASVDIKPRVQPNTTFALAPPNSSRTPSPLATTPFSVHSATGLKRALSPLKHEVKNGGIQDHQKKPKKNSSSFDPPSPPDGTGPAGERGTGEAEGRSSTSATDNPRVTIETIRPLLAPGALKEPRPVPLFKNLRARSVKGKKMPPLFRPNPRELREIASQLRDYASPEYLRAMADDYRYCEVWEDWFDEAKQDVEKWEPAVTPMLQVLARTDMPVDYIRDIKFRAKAKTIANLAQERNLAHKGAIQTAWQRYRAYVEDTLFPLNRVSPEYAEMKAEEARNNKRKLDAVAQDEGKPGPSKMPTPATNGNTTKSAPSAGAAPAPTKSSTAPKSATDMSFFGPGGGTGSSSASTGIIKPKIKLPDIKKVEKSFGASRPPASLTTGGVSGLLASTLSSLTKNVGGSTPTNSNIRSGGSTPEYEKKDVKPARYNAKGKLIRNVRFKDVVREEEGGGALVQVKEFKEELWEFETPEWEKNLSEEDASSASSHGQTLHQLDMAEGAALAKNWGHELIDWYEPEPYWDAPADYPPVTPEFTAQTQREHGILAIAYPPGMPVPDPTESAVRVVESDDNQMRMMDPVSDSDLILQHQTRGVNAHAPQPAGSSVVAPQASVSDLLKNLSGLQNVIPPTSNPGPNPYQPQPSTSSANDNYHSYGYQGQAHHGYSSHQQQPQRRWGAQNSYGDKTPAWGGNDNYARQGYDHRESRRPQDRDPSRPICRFWPRE
ncbi:hypothetical protein IAT40_001185 [Kwoniella sp. CBS 6097]